MRVGLLGAGRIGKVHAHTISTHPNSTLAMICDAVKENAEILASQYSAQVSTTDEIIHDSSIDAVLIATSTDTHADLIEKANSAGKAVLCEKPVDLSLERARNCMQKVDQTKAPVMIGFNRRFDTNFTVLKKAAQNGEIGKLELLSITSFDPAPPPVEYVKVSGGLFRDMMIHDFDIANYIMGEKPVFISAVGSSLVDQQIGQLGDVDTAVVTLSYDDGRIAIIKNSRRAVYGYDQRIELLGSEGLLQAGNMLENNVVKSNNAGVTSAKPTYFFLERYMQAYQAEWAAFVNAIINGEPMPVSLDDGVTALAMAEAATRSIKENSRIKLENIN